MGYDFVVKKQALIKTVAVIGAWIQKSLDSFGKHAKEETNREREKEREREANKLYFDRERERNHAAGAHAC